MIEDLYRLQPPPGIRVAYGAEQSQVGDLRLPRGQGPHPLVISIHGGNWRASYGSVYMGHLCATLAEAGIATWNIEYRRLGEAGGGWPATFLDVAAAADLVRELAPLHALDLSRVIALGHSAGGQLALWLAARPRIARESPLYSRSPLPLRGAIGLAAISDLSRYWELGISNGVAGELMGGAPDAVPERYAAASPIELLPLGLSQVLIHGTEDEDVPFELSERYVAAAMKVGDAAQLIALPGAGHFEPVDPRTPEWNQVMDAVRELLR